MIFLLNLLFDYPGSITNVNYFSFSAFSAAKLSSKLLLLIYKTILRLLIDLIFAAARVSLLETFRNIERT